MPPGNTPLATGLMSALSPSSSSADLGNMGLNFFEGGELFVTILESRNVQDGLIGRLDLVRYYESRNIEDARKSLTASTQIKEDRDSGVITINVTERNPALAANIARGYVEELNRVVAENSTSAARRERIFLEERVKDIKQQLDDSAQQLSQFSTKSGAIDVSSQTRSMIDEGLKLQGELIDGRSQLAALQQTYSEDNSKVRALEAHNAELQRELDKMGGMSPGSGDTTDTNKSPYPSVDQLPALGLTYFDLERKMRVDEALWETLTRQYEAAKVEEAAEIPTVQVLDVANIPGRKSAPSRRLIVELGALISLALACIAVFLSITWEGMNAEDEPKKLIKEAVSAALSSRHPFWGLPGLRWIHRRITGAA